MTFVAGHPDFMDSASNPVKQLVAAATVPVAPGTFATAPLTLGQTSGLLQVVAAGCELVDVMMNVDGSVIGQQWRTMAGDLTPAKTSWVVVAYPPGNNPTVRLWNLSNALESVTLRAYLYLNGYAAMMRPHHVARIDTATPVTAGSTTTVAALDSVGMFDRVAGVVVADQAFSASILWGALHTPAAPPSSMVTFGQALGAAVANTPVFFDVAVVGAAGVVQVHNTGAVSTTPKVSVRQYVTG